jgi:hypothetical protein
MALPGIDFDQIAPRREEAALDLEIQKGGPIGRAQLA